MIEIETIIERNPAPKPRFSLIDEMWIERGTKDDWELLHDLHYKAEALPIGPRYWRLVLRGETIGVLVTGGPRGMVRERHIVFPNIKPKAGDTRLINTNRYHYINKNFRVVSRFVIDTMYRGIGAGYRMMNLASRLEGFQFMEIVSSMSKFNTFGQKAGYRFVTPSNANKYEPVMKFLRSHFAASPQDFEGILTEIEAKSPAEQEKILVLCQDFYFRHSALENTSNNGAAMEQRRASFGIREIIKGIQQMGLASPMYGIWKNPDLGQPMPERLPLTAFDLQKPTERLRYVAP